MSIINEALKKAQQDKQQVPLSKESLRKNFEMEFGSKKAGFNWGPLFVISVLLLITIPILSPIFQANPVKHSNFLNAFSSVQAPLAAPFAATDNRKAQFMVEEAPMPLMPQGLSTSPLGGTATFMGETQKTYYSLTGVVLSGDGSYCVINDQVLRQGDRIGEAVVKAIAQDSVVLAYGEEMLTLRLS